MYCGFGESSDAPLSTPVNCSPFFTVMTASLPCERCQYCRLAVTSTSDRLLGVSSEVTYDKVCEQEQGAIVCLILVRVAGALRKLFWGALERLVCAIGIVRLLIETFSPRVLWRQRWLLHSAWMLAHAKSITCGEGRMVVNDEFGVCKR